MIERLDVVDEGKKEISHLGCGIFTAGGSKVVAVHFVGLGVQKHGGLDGPRS